MISYGEIIAVVVFLAIAIIAIIALVTKRVREKRVEDRKEKRLRGEPVDEDEDRKGGIEKLFLKYFKSSYIPLTTGYIIVLIIFSKSFPEAWADWRGSNIFWLSLVAIVVSFWLFTLKGYGRTMAIGIWILLLTVVTYSNWPERIPPTSTETESSYVQTYAQQQQETRNGVKTRYVIAPPNGKWSEVIDVPLRHGFDCVTNPAYGPNNSNKLIAVLINDNKVLSQQRLPDGRIIDPDDPNANARFIRVTCLDRTPAHTIVSFPKR